MAITELVDGSDADQTGATTETKDDYPYPKEFFIYRTYAVG